MVKLYSNKRFSYKKLHLVLIESSWRLSAAAFSLVVSPLTNYIQKPNCKENESTGNLFYVCHPLKHEY